MATKSQEEQTIKVTQAHYDEMVAELEERKQKQMDIAQEIDEARKLGDLSENDPYKQAMEKKEMNDAAIARLEDNIRFAEIVEDDKDNIISIGNRVTLINQATKQQREITLVSPITGEADPREGKISTDTPIGSAINHATYGSEVEVQLPGGTATYLLKRA